MIFNRAKEDESKNFLKINKIIYDLNLLKYSYDKGTIIREKIDSAIKELEIVREELKCRIEK